MLELKKGFSFEPSKVVAVEKIDEKSIRILFQGNEATLDVNYDFFISMMKSTRSFKTTHLG